MELWILYAGIAAVLIAMRDIFDKKFSSKYSPTEHLLFYYLLCGFFIIILALYKHYIRNEKIRLIETKDMWKYVIVGAISALIIAPCQILALKNCDNPGKTKAVVNLNSVFAFFLAIYFLRENKFEPKTFIGITLAAFGVYLII